MLGPKFQSQSLSVCRKLLDVATEAAPNMPSPWNTPSALLRSAVQASLAAEQTQALDNATVLTWGKHAGNTVAKALQDTAYIKWLLVNQNKISSLEGIQLLKRAKAEYRVEDAVMFRVNQTENMLQKNAESEKGAVISVNPGQLQDLIRSMIKERAEANDLSRKKRRRLQRQVQKLMHLTQYERPSLSVIKSGSTQGELEPCACWSETDCHQVSNVNELHQVPGSHCVCFM